jgi:hypothetical protein
MPPSSIYVQIKDILFLYTHNAIRQKEFTNEKPEKEGKVEKNTHKSGEERRYTCSTLNKCTSERS